MENKIAALYIRVSTEDQTELSPAAQKRILMDHAKKKGYIVSGEHIYYDDGISGRKTDKREGFKQMIATAKQKPSPFDIILVHKFSRFARNQEDSLVYKNLLKRDGVSVESVTEPIIDGPFGQLIERIIEWMDEYYSINLSEEVMKGMTEKAMQGGYQTIPPLGYSKKKDEIPYINEEEAKIVKIIYDKYINENYCITEIARYLNDLNYRSRRGNPFENRTIQYILTNPFYKGDIRWNGIYREGKHEKLIDNETFEKVQVRIEREKRGYRKRKTAAKHWLSGVLKCGVCGKNLAFQSRESVPIEKRGNPYFVCHEYAKGKHKGSNSITVDKLTSSTLDSLKKIINTGKIDFKVAKTTLNGVDPLEKIEKEINKISVKETRIKEAYINGIDTIEEYKVNKEILSKNRNSLEEQKKEILELHTNVEALKPAMIDRIKDVIQILESDADVNTKYGAITSVVEKIVHNKEKDLLEFFYQYS